MAISVLCKTSFCCFLIHTSSMCYIIKVRQEVFQPFKETFVQFRTFSRTPPKELTVLPDTIIAKFRERPQKRKREGKDKERERWGPFTFLFPYLFSFPFLEGRGKRDGSTCSDGSRETDDRAYTAVCVWCDLGSTWVSCVVDSTTTSKTKM